MLDRRVAGANELLADGAPHRAAHEREVHHRQLERMAVERRRADDDRLGETGVQLGLGEPLDVGPEVEELERIGRANVGRLLDERALVGEPRDPGPGRHREMVAALAADVERRRELVVAIVRLAARAGVRVLLLGRRWMLSARP